MSVTAASAAIDPGRARRYACALTGSWRAGDMLLQHVSHNFAAQPDAIEDTSAAISWYRVASRFWNGPGGELIEKVVPSGSRTPSGERRRVAGMSRQSREAFLLTTIGGLSPRQAALATGQSVTEIAALLEAATASTADADRACVTIIEDEPLIARDLQKIVEQLGHRVTGKARTLDEAVTRLRQAPPDLVLADMQLLDGSSGVDAVNTILAEAGDLPVIFITAFPEQLIGGHRPGPTFLICKPYEPVEVRDAITQILYFGIKSSMAPYSDSEDGPPLVRFDKLEAKSWTERTEGAISP